MRLFLAIVLVLCLALPAAAGAQNAMPLQNQMSADEFKAAGLDKLTPTELANLNTWLARAITAEAETKAQAAVAKATDSAREEGRQEVIKKNRGFFDFGSEEPITGIIQGEFSGFGSGRHYTLDNGQIWEQIDSTRLDGVRKSNIKASIRPSKLGVWWLKVDGYNTQAKVRRIE